MLLLPSMRRLLLASLVFFAACSGESPGPDPSDPDAAVSDVDGGPTCTGAAYDSCQDTTSWSDCQDGMECRFFDSAGFTICIPHCDAQTPCPDQDGTPVNCNQMGRCRPQVANSCELP